MRVWGYLLLIATVQAVPAAAQDAPYYGPMKAWHGIGFKFGYKHAIAKDGSWKIEAATRRGEAVDLAMRRAAELARDEGYAYVEMLGGSASRSPGINSATLYARPARTAAAPAACRSKRRDCYTADVATLLRGQPGVPVTDHFDRYGRAVSYSGYGYAAASTAPHPVAAPPPVVVAHAAGCRRADGSRTLPANAEGRPAGAQRSQTRLDDQQLIRSPRAGRSGRPRRDTGGSRSGRSCRR